MIDRRGKYRATFWMGIDIDGESSAGTMIAEIRATRGLQKEVLKIRRLREKDWQNKRTIEPFSIIFELNRPSVVEFPVYYQGNGILWVDRIKVVRLG